MNYEYIEVPTSDTTYFRCGHAGCPSLLAANRGKYYLQDDGIYQATRRYCSSLCFVISLGKLYRLGDQLQEVTRHDQRHY
jgi:hypothetical protein